MRRYCVLCHLVVAQLLFLAGAARGANFRATKWTNDGSVHCYWVGLTGTEVKPRFCLRPGYLDAIPKIGVEVGARTTENGMEVEFELPWKNFPGFTGSAGQVIGVAPRLVSTSMKQGY